MKIDPIKLAQDLIKFPSITPTDAGIIDFLINLLEAHNFICQKLVYDDVTNLYARSGNSEPNVCFAGHTDVVPVGGQWSVDPFEAVIKENKLIGRGVVDMKGAIAAFISAAIEFIHTNKNFKGSISFLITGDEEGPATNGTKKVLEHLSLRGEKIDACIVGEPTSVKIVGDMIKYGRRGSISFHLKVLGKQGHVAYPHLADNPIDKLVDILNSLKSLKLDDGNEDFSPSNLEITNVVVNNPTGNVIPGKAEAFFNIRYNNIHSAESIINKIKEVCGEYDLESKISAEAFLGNKDSPLIKDLISAIKKVRNIDPEISTTGGTSDARFIKNYAPVVELGLLNKTAHQVDEQAEIDDILELKKIYICFLESYYKN